MPQTPSTGECGAFARVPCVPVGVALKWCALSGARTTLVQLQSAGHQETLVKQRLKACPILAHFMQIETQTGRSQRPLFSFA
jgi:hypothetical protein